jgi:hypothetical protein
MLELKNIMKYCYSISESKTFSLEQAKEIFPDNSLIEIKNGKYFLIVTTMTVLDKDVFIEVQRECDRIFFLTGTQLNPQFEWKKDDDGVTIHLQSIKNDVRWVKKIPENLTKQQWDSDLTVQLRLWQFAKPSDLPIAARINLLFQIIEISLPMRSNRTNYPFYHNSNTPPSPRTESLLLRDLVSHGKGTIGNPQLKEYCNFLQINDTFYDPTDATSTKAIKGRFDIIEKEALKVISEQITLNE